MSTNTTTAATASATAGQRRKLHLLGLLAVVLGLFAPAVALAEPAQATGAVGTQISFCAPSKNYPVQLQVWNGTKWVGYKNGNSGATGCGTFRYVDAGYYYKVALSASVNTGNCYTSYTVTYSTGWKASVANRNVNVGSMSYEGGFYWCR